MSFKRSELNLEAKKLSFVTDTYEKVVRLSNILEFLNSVPFLANHLALKGGTAINLGILNLPRLSVDIDLDFTGDVSREEMMESRSKIKELILLYIAENGYVLDNTTRVHYALDSFHLRYINSGGNKDIIKIEINYLLRNHVFEPVMVHTSSFGLVKSLEIRMVHPYEIYGSKLVALMTRATPRDLYDFYNMIHLHLFNEDEMVYIRKCAVFYRAISHENGDFDFNLLSLNSIIQRDIRRFLVPVIKSNEKFILKNVMKEVTEFFEEYLIPSKEETLFLNQFAQSIYSPELLFQDEDILSRLKNHPMAIWKTKNKVPN